MTQLAESLQNQTKSNCWLDLLQYILQMKSIFVMPNLPAKHEVLRKQFVPAKVMMAN